MCEYTGSEKRPVFIKSSGLKICDVSEGEGLELGNCCDLKGDMKRIGRLSGLSVNRAHGLVQ